MNTTRCMNNHLNCHLHKDIIISGVALGVHEDRPHPYQNGARHNQPQQHKVGLA